MLALAIGAVLIALLGQILFSGLHGAAGFTERVNRDNDVTFALNSMVDELQGADAVYRVQENAVQFYVREKGEEGHKVVTYIFEGDILSRYAYHSHIKYEKNRLGLAKGIRTLLLKHVDQMTFEKKGDLLEIRLRAGKETKRIIALRGAYD